MKKTFTISCAVFLVFVVTSCATHSYTREGDTLHIETRNDLFYQDYINSITEKECPYAYENTGHGWKGKTMLFTIKCIEEKK